MTKELKWIDSELGCQSVNENGDVILHSNYEYGEPIRDTDLYLASNGRAIGLITLTGEVLTEFKYVDVKTNGNNYLTLMTGKTVGVFSLKEKRVILDADYTGIRYIDKDICVLCKDGKCAYFDLKTEKYITEYIYTDATEFINGTALVTLNNKVCLINEEFEVLREYDYTYVYTNGTDYLVASNKSIGNQVLLSRNGDVISKRTFDYISKVKLGLFVVDKKRKSGLLDTKGKLVCKCMYDDIFIFEKLQVIVVRLGNKKALMDLTGKLLTDFIFTYSECMGTTIPCINLATENSSLKSFNSVEEVLENFVIK